jgi:hypothetical protein
MIPMYPSRAHEKYVLVAVIYPMTMLWTILPLGNLY